MNPIIIANWKMNLQLQDAIHNTHIISHYSNSKDLIIAPPIAYLSYLSQNFKNIAFCAQNISEFREFGPYTGECSAEIIKSCDVNYALIGHSDRRNFFMEDNNAIRSKILNAINANITPIICIGETLQERQNNSYKNYITQQLADLFTNIHKNITQNNKIIIAYEPIWSIGSGMTPNTENISEIFELIISNKHLHTIAKNIRLVYGGSVNVKNYHEIMRAKHIDGVLIGGASIDTDQLATIMNYAHQ